MLKNIHIWMGSYIKQALMKARRPSGKPAHVIFCLADHFEPKWGKPDSIMETVRIVRWIEKYVALAAGHKDADGYHPRYTFFYPQEEYEEDHLNKIAVLCRLGLGEVEMHIHHDNDTPEGLKEKLEDFKKKLLCHGLLSKDKEGNTRFAFIHGNWALNNSRNDRRWCGVDNEIAVLKECGCYADFTLPSAPSDTQTKKINSIYYANGSAKPKSHNTGIDVEAGKEPLKDLMIIQGPLAFNWHNRKFGIFPRIENSGISFYNPPTGARVNLWVDQQVSVKGRPDWIFVKIYTHGMQDDNLRDEYFNNLDKMFGYLEKKYNDGKDCKLHYVTAREMYNIVKAAEAGKAGDPGLCRDYELGVGCGVKGVEKK